ncbi:MAG: sugar phosphate isomerase/epimerase [Caldilineaceae bacterium]
MQLIMFTKHLEGLDVPAIIEALNAVGVDGADLCVRNGYPVNPENIATALPAAARQFAAAGLSIPLVTAPGDFNRPDIDYAERYYAACGEAGVKHVKLGYWHWQPGMRYWEEVDKIRGYLDQFQALSARFGVQTVVHNHSGRSMGLHSCAAMNLVKGFDPQHIGVFSDPGHLSVCGEPIDMALDIVRDYLSVLAFKDMIRERVVKDGVATWATPVRKLGWGFVDWPTTIAALKSMHFSGPISMHSEYAGEPPETVIDLARADTRFIRSLVSSVDS